MQNKYVYLSDFFLSLVHCECATAAIAHNRCCRSNAESKFVTLVDDDGDDDA